MEPLLKCGEIRSHGQLVSLTHDMQLNLVVSVWDEKDVTDQHSTTIRIIDINSGNLVSQATFKNSNRKSISCVYHPFLDKLVLTDGQALCVRRDTNGRFLLTNVFTCPVASTSDEIALELLLPHAVQLKDVIDFALTTSQGASIAPIAYLGEQHSSGNFSTRKLNFSLIASQLQDLLAQVTPETSSVVLRLRQSTFCSLLYWLMSILGDTMHCGNHLRNRVLNPASASTPPLYGGTPLISDSGMGKSSSASSKAGGTLAQPHAILPVVSSLYLQAIMQLSDPYNEIPKEHMFAEVFRYETFLEWPHIDYEWAGPSSMALAGFYYQPACRAEDRAVCFQCGVSLVSWEPTDEPWSEHERHAPSCPMVTGDITSNVPLAESESFEPAQLIFTTPRFSPVCVDANSQSSDLESASKIRVLTSSNDGLVITVNPLGNVVLWDATRRLKRCASFFLISDFQNNLNAKDAGKSRFSAFCLPDIAHFDSDSVDHEGSNRRKSSMGNNKPSSKQHQQQATNQEDEYVRIVAGGYFGEQNELYVLEYILEPPLWADSRCQTEGARSGAQPPFTSSSSAPMNDNFNLLQYDMWDDDSPPYEDDDQHSDDDGAQLIADEIAQSVENDVAEQVADQVANSVAKQIHSVVGDEPKKLPKAKKSDKSSSISTTSTANELITGTIEPKSGSASQEQLDIPPPASTNEIDVEEPQNSSANRQVFFTKPTQSGGTEPVSAKRALKLPDLFQNENFAISGIYHISSTEKVQKLVVVLNDQKCESFAQSSSQCECWACDQSNENIKTSIGGVVVYKFRPTLRRGGAQSSAVVNAVDQNFDQPLGVYTIPAFLHSQFLLKPPSFMFQNAGLVSDAEFNLKSTCGYLLNLLPGANAIALYAVFAHENSGVTSLDPLTTLSLTEELIDNGHVTHFVYCADVDTITAGSCQSRLSFWKKVSQNSQQNDSMNTLKSQSENTPEKVLSMDAAPTAASYHIDMSTVKHLLKISHASRLDQRYTITCPNGWSEMASDQASRMHPGGPGTDLSPTRAGAGGPNPPTRSFTRHGFCMRDSNDSMQALGLSSSPEQSLYAAFDLAFTHSLHISHIVAAFGFDPLDCSLEDCKVYLLRQKDTWGTIKFGNLKAGSTKPGLHALQSQFDFGAYEILCGPIEVSQFILRNEQPGPSSSSQPSGPLKSVVMLTSPELITSSSRNLTVLLEYSSSSVALAAAYTQQQNILNEASSSVLGSTTPPPPNVGPPVISATVALTPTYLPKYKHVQASPMKKHLLNNAVDLSDFLFQEEAQLNFFNLLLSLAGSNSAALNLENQANFVDALSLLSWLITVSHTEICGSTFTRMTSRIVESFDALLHLAFIYPSTASRESATILSEIVLIIADHTKTDLMGPVVERFFDKIFLDSVTSQIQSPTMFHLFFKLASRLAELQLVSTGNALPSKGFSKLATLGEILSVQTHAEHIQVVSGDSLSSNSQIFDLPLPNHLLENSAKPTSYASVVAGLFGGPGAGGQPPASYFGSSFVNDPSKNENPWSNFAPYQTLTNLSMVTSKVFQSNKPTQADVFSETFTHPASDVAYATGPRHIFGLIEYECLHFRFQKFCQGARAGSPRTGFKVSPPPSIKIPVLASTIQTPSAGGEPSWQPTQGFSASQPGATQPILPLVHSYFPTLSEANATFSSLEASSGGPSVPKKPTGSGLIYTVDEVPTADEVPVSSSVPISVLYVANSPQHSLIQSSVPPTPKPTPYITPSVTPPNELSGTPVLPALLPGPVSVPSNLQNPSANAQDAVMLGHGFDYLSNLLSLDYCNNWVAFDRSSASSRRFVDLDFGRPVVLTGFIIPVNADVLSVAVDVWLKPDDDKHHKAKRICSHMRLKQEPLVMLNLQPAPVCRFLRLWCVFTVGATQGRISMCVGQYYGHSLLSPCRLSSLSTISNLIGPSFWSHSPTNFNPSSTATCLALVNLHSQVLQTCVEDQLYRFREAMSDLTTISQVYANPSHVASLWTSGQRAIETRLRVCVGGAFVWRCQLNHCRNLAQELRSLVGNSSGLLDSNEPLDKIQQIFYYLLRIFYVQARLGLLVKISLDDASRLFQAVCLFANEELRGSVGQLIVHFAADVQWWPEFFRQGLQKLFTSYLFSPDITSLNSNSNSISLGDYCNLFILLIDQSPEQANAVVVVMLQNLQSTLQSSSGLSDSANVGMVLFLSICLDALLSSGHWMVDLWSFAPGSLSSVKAQWNPNLGSSSSNSSGSNSNQNQGQQARLGVGPLSRRGAVYKKKYNAVNKLNSKLSNWSSIAKHMSADERTLWPSLYPEDEINFGAPASNAGSGEKPGSPVTPAPCQILTRLPYDLCKAVTESLLRFVLESHQTTMQTPSTSMVFADVHALKLAAYLSCFATPELSLSQIFGGERVDALANLLELIVHLKDAAFLAGEASSSVDSTRSAIRAHAAECFLKTVLLSEKIARKAAQQNSAALKIDQSGTEESAQGPFSSLFAAIKEQEESSRNSTEELFNRFFALLHATRCQQISQKSQLLGKTHKCKAAECQPAKKMLEHWKSCSDAHECSYKHCMNLRLLVNHWRTCKRFDVCAPCKELAKFPLVFEPAVMNSIESLADCRDLPEDSNGICPAPADLDPAAISSTMNDLLLADETDLGGTLDVCFVDDFFDEVLQPPATFASTSSASISSPPLPSFAFDCRYDFSLLHHAKYLMGCLQARNYAEISNLPPLKTKREKLKDEKKENTPSIDVNVSETSALIFQSITSCLSSSSSRGLSSLARCCEIIDELLPYTKVTNGQLDQYIVAWVQTIFSAISTAPSMVKSLRHSYEDIISLNTVFLETCMLLVSKSNGPMMVSTVSDLFVNPTRLKEFINAILLIGDSSINPSTGFEYGPTFCQTLISFLRGMLEILIEKIGQVGLNIANCLCTIISGFIDIQMVAGGLTCWLPVDLVGSFLPFLVEMRKNVKISGFEREWVRLGVNLIKIISLTCCVLPRTEAALKLRGNPNQASSNAAQGAAALAKNRGRGRGGLYAHRWDEVSRPGQPANDVVVMRLPPSNSELSKCAYPETATAFGSLLSDELALLEQILGCETLFNEVLNEGSAFSNLLSILYWNGICCQSATGIAASDPSSSICALDTQHLNMSAFGPSAYKTCQGIFNLLVDNFSQKVSGLLLNSVCHDRKMSGWDTRSAALVIVQAVLDKMPDVATAHRDVICEILFVCFEEIITNEKLAQKTSSAASSSSKIFDLSPLAKIIPGAVNLPLSNLISQQNQGAPSSSAFSSSRSQRLLYELVNAGAKGSLSAGGANLPMSDQAAISSQAFGDPRPIPIPTQRGQSGRGAPSICGYTYAPSEDHFSFAVHFTLPVVLAEVVVGCDLGHSRGHLPQAVEIEVRSDKQQSGGCSNISLAGGGSLPLRFSATSSHKPPYDCLAIAINPPRIASSLLVSIYKPKSANAVYLNSLSLRGFPLTSGPSAQSQLLAEVDRISSSANSYGALSGQSGSPNFVGLPLSSSEVTFLSLLHSVTTLGKLRMLSTTERNVSGLLRLASCSALALMAPSNIITPTILQNLLEMINICIDSLHDEGLASQFVCSLVDVYIEALARRSQRHPTLISNDVTAFCLFVYSLAHWRSAALGRALLDKLIDHFLEHLSQHIGGDWQTFDQCLLPLAQCISYLLWKNEKVQLNSEQSEKLSTLFAKVLALGRPKTGSDCLPYWPPPIQALLNSIFNHRAIEFESLALQFVELYTSLDARTLQLQCFDFNKAVSALQPLVNVFLSPRCLDWFLRSSRTLPLTQEILKLLATPNAGPVSISALGFTLALCRSQSGCHFVSECLQDSDWQRLLQNAVQSTCDFRYQDLVLQFFTQATLANLKSQMKLGTAFAQLLRQNQNNLAGSMPCFMRAFCNRLLLADCDISFYCTPDFDDPSTIIYDTDIIPFAGFPAICMNEFVAPPFSSSVRLNGPGRCTMLDLMTRSKRHHQIASSIAAQDPSGAGDDTVSTKAAKMLKMAAIHKRRASKDLTESDQNDDLKAISSLKSLCLKFAQEGGLERDAVSASIAWRPPARWLIKKCYYAPRRPGDQAIASTRSVRSLLCQKTDSELLSNFFSNPLLELSGFAALPTPELIQSQATDTSTVPHLLSAFAQVGGLDALALFFPLPTATQASPAEMPSAVTSALSALMDPASSELPDDWVDIQDIDSDSTIDFASPKNVIVLGGPSTILSSSALGGTAGLNSMILAQQFFLPISALALRVFSRLPDLANLLTSVTCLPLTQAALRLALGLGVDMIPQNNSNNSSPGGIVKAMGLLPSLPFLALEEFITSCPAALSLCLDAGCIDFLLAAMHILSRQQDSTCTQSNSFVNILQGSTGGSGAQGSSTAALLRRNNNEWDDMSQNPSQHWAKGTGFGSGPTTVNQTFDSRLTQARQRQEEQLLTLCFRLISRFVGASTIDRQPYADRMFAMISNSCFVKILSSYLQNDSIMDVSRHLLLYETALNLWSILADEEMAHGRQLGLFQSCAQMTGLLASFEDHLAAYVGTLRVITASQAPSKKSHEETTATITEVCPEGAAESDLDPLLAAVRRAQKSNERLVHAAAQLKKQAEMREGGDSMETDQENISRTEENSLSIDERYAAALKSLQFRSWVIVSTSGSSANSTFVAKVPYHFIGNMSAGGFSSSAARARRIAQETVSLRSSLPLSLSSSVFVAVDEARLDVIKVIITGPADTPYANGCFEFDISLPSDYPNSPPLVHLCTTGNGQVRFNPNLYNDGKVCLSVLNTWHGRPEEKWNPQTSSLLQVLVSIQSLILVSEPYFNEPGYERSRGSAAARIASAEYSAEIMAQTLKWAVVEQLRRPSQCFADIVRRHFAIKKNELLAQCDQWIELVKSMGAEASGAAPTTAGTEGNITSAIFSPAGPTTAGSGASANAQTGSSGEVVLVGSSGRRFQQMLVALRRSVDQVKEELKNLDSLVKSGDVFGDTNKHQ